MNTQQKRMIISIVCIFFIMLLPMLALADEIDGTPSENIDTPIDGGLSLLVAAGVGYGAKKIKERKANRRNMLNATKY